MLVRLGQLTQTRLAFSETARQYNMRDAIRPTFTRQKPSHFFLSTEKSKHLNGIIGVMVSFPLQSQFAPLFQEFEQGPLQGVFQLIETSPPFWLISNVNIIPQVGARWLIIVDHHQQWDIPGGTLEPGETYRDALQREMMEETGTKLISFHPFGAFHYHTTAAKPYRPHLPHPEFYRLVGYGQVEVVASPNDPDQHVTGIDLVSIDEAVDRFRQQGREDLALLYLLAAQLAKEQTQ